MPWPLERLLVGDRTQWLARGSSEGLWKAGIAMRLSKPPNPLSMQAMIMADSQPIASGVNGSSYYVIEDVR